MPDPLAVLTVTDAPTYAALLTPVGRGAVATIAVAGPQAATRVAAFFERAGGGAVRALLIGRIAFGRWGGPEGEEIVVGRRGEYEFEIHCHGGEAAPRAILDDLIAAGCSALDWRQWLGRVERDPLAADARVALAAATTEQTALVLLDQAQGALRAAMQQIVDHVAAERCEVATEIIDLLLRFATFGLHLTTPWKVVLAGRPNVGKSSLINALVGYERAIVFDQPGTTRDVVTANTALNGWPVELSDTAGLRTASDKLEAAGIELTQSQLASADLVVLVFDASASWTAEDEALCAAWPNALVLQNKADLLAPNATQPRGLLTSTLSGAGLAELANAIAQRLVPEVPAPGQAVAFTPEQIESLRHVRQALEKSDFAAAIAVLNRLLGDHR